MTTLSPSGQQLVQDLAQRYGLSIDGVTHMLIAVHNGGGTMAQFGHPDFCGSGQWMRGGMTMVSDLFNHSLKSMVDNLCNELSNALANHQSSPIGGTFQSQSQSGQDSQHQTAGSIGGQNSLFVSDKTSLWWPKELGTPSATGSQNNTRYAYFANQSRLAVSTGASVWVYDTLDHQIGGFSQQQGPGGSITFTSQYGTVNLSALPVVMRDGQACEPAPVPTEMPVAEANSCQELASVEVGVSANETRIETPNSDQLLGTIERLGMLRDKGLLSEEEFATKKSEILSRL